MAESQSSQLVAAMDRLWYHQVILSSDPTSVLCSKTALQSSSCSSSESFLLEGDNNNASSIASTNSISLSKQEQQKETDGEVFDKDDINKKDEEIKSKQEQQKETEGEVFDKDDINKKDEELKSKQEQEKDGEAFDQDDINKNDEEIKRQRDRMGRERPSRLDLIGKKFRSKSSSPSIQHYSNNNYNKEGQKLQRFLSCSKLHDLELEELKGFMDLGFKFEKDHLSPQTMRVLPGLQRLEGQHEDAITSSNYGFSSSTFDDDKIDEGKYNSEKTTTTEVGKPYLSESWLVKRPNSPLLRLRMARVSRAEDMKKCLKLWARTVASSMQPDE